MLNFRLTVIGNCRFGLGDTLGPLLNAGLISRDIYNATLIASLITILANATFFKFMKISPGDRLKAAS